jgi:hypothetical protein
LLRQLALRSLLGQSTTTCRAQRLRHYFSTSGPLGVGGIPPPRLGLLSVTTRSKKGRCREQGGRCVELRSRTPLSVHDRAPQMVQANSHSRTPERLASCAQAKTQARTASPPAYFKDTPAHSPPLGTRQGGPPATFALVSRTRGRTTTDPFHGPRLHKGVASRSETAKAG